MVLTLLTMVEAQEHGHHGDIAKLRLQILGRATPRRVVERLCEMLPRRQNANCEHEREKKRDIDKKR